MPRPPQRSRLRGKSAAQLTGYIRWDDITGLHPLLRRALNALHRATLLTRIVIGLRTRESLMPRANTANDALPPLIVTDVGWHESSGGAVAASVSCKCVARLVKQEATGGGVPTSR